ncbi:hypothetical protein JR316_0004598 [Psilocybe cubensis]|uniref:Uncharacterized protein n=2 Tax=Psilocybe cubensis TaxID=181762 RepID=A0A8H8CLI4_PSICU|nr:hypothetical protein JR316_0004598 [Psilocybe cubensis]KAH9482498.1 hypothetical protein JR316_0004598 [Psilocybe cubensis]
MESALHAMDQLERDIQQNYIYNRRAPSNPWAPYLPSSRGGYTNPPSGSEYFQPRPPADIRINRSNASDASQSSSGSEIARWPGRQEERYEYRTTEHGGYTGYSGRPDRHYHHHHRERPAASFHRPSVPRSHSHSHSQSRSRPRDVYAPPITPHNSTYTRHYVLNDNPAGFPEEPPNPLVNQQDSPRSNDGHRLLIDYGGSQTHDLGADHDSIPPSSPNALTPEWSMETTRGSENLSHNSSLGYHSEDSGRSGYGYGRSRGYIEPYSHDHSLEDGYHEYLDDGEHGYASDGVASDEGVYYSSDEGPYSDGGAYSDGGYSSYYSDYYEDDDDGLYNDASDSE